MLRINNKRLFAITQRTLNHADFRLVDHGKWAVYFGSQRVAGQGFIATAARRQTNG